MSAGGTPTRTIFVTGAGGFLGQHIVQHFLNEGWQVCGLGRGVALLAHHPALHRYELSLPDYQLAELLRRYKPSVLIHGASTANVGASVQDPANDFMRTVDVWQQLVETVRTTHPLCKLVYLSSAAVYGNPIELPVHENHVTKPISPYGYHKRICEEIGEYYAGLYSLAISNARVFSAYGPGLYRQVIWDMYQKLLTQDIVRLIGTGAETRDFIYVTDVVRALACIVEAGDWYATTYNVASGRGITISDVTKHMIDILGLHKPVYFDGQQRQGDPLYWQADISRIRRLGFSPQVGLKDGLRQLVESLRAEQVTSVR